MINIVNLCQLSKRHKIIEINWIYGYNNPAKLITKKKSSSALKTFINTNCINIDIIEQIEQDIGIKKIKETKKKIN